MSVSTKAFSDMILLEAAENGDKVQMKDCLSDFSLVKRLALARDEENRTALHLACRPYKAASMNALKRAVLRAILAVLGDSHPTDGQVLHSGPPLADCPPVTGLLLDERHL